MLVVGYVHLDDVTNDRASLCWLLFEGRYRWLVLRHNTNSCRLDIGCWLAHHSLMHYIYATALNTSMNIASILELIISAQFVELLGVDDRSNRANEPELLKYVGCGIVVVVEYKTAPGDRVEVEDLTQI